MTKTSLDKVADYVTELVLGGADKNDTDAREVRQMVLVQIATEPAQFLAFARGRMEKVGRGEKPDGWVMGAVHMFVDANITIDDPTAAAQYIMEKIKERFKDEFALVAA